MTDVYLVLVLAQISTFSITVFLALIYVVFILSIRRLRHVHNAFKLNVCFALTGCNVFFIVFFTMNRFYTANLYVDKYCLFLFYAYMVGPLQVPLAFISFSIHRLFLIIYYTGAFFQRKRWAILCLTTQWILGFLIPIPYLIRDQPYCFIQRWMHIYSMIFIVLIPPSIILFINFLIFLSARSSTKRIQPQPFSVVTTTQSVVNQVQRSKLSRRDISLLKQMAYMFFIFVGGWGPIYIILNLEFLNTTVPLLMQIFVVLASLSSFIIIINLFVNDYEIRQWFREQFRRCLTL